MYDPNEKTSTLGRLSSPSKITPYEAKQEALLLLRRGRLKPGTKLAKVMALLATGGVFLEEHLIELTSAKKRTLQRYRQKGYLDLLPTPPKLEKLIKDARVYALGPIGLALGELQHEVVPTGYLSTTTDRVTHDVLCNLVYYHLYKTGQTKGFTAILKGKYEVRIHNRKGMAMLEPDACIILRGKDYERHFLVEYHNENFSGRAAEKIQKYEYVYKDCDWKAQWEVKRFPPILIVTTHSPVAHGYKKDIEERQVGRGVRCRYLIKPLRTLLEQSQSPLFWLDLDKNKTINILR